MDATSFEFHLAVPAQAPFHTVVHLLMVKSGAYAGCPPAAAADFADAVLTVITGLRAGSVADVRCSRQGRRFEVLVAGDGPEGSMLSAGAGPVQVRCRREAGQWRCTVALDV